ncbi:unnamed protein product [Acanthosepion pharaonis]|uniref:Helitron helicase-like domain-containing protein n=1 Tax=Acanthosepion pharaonis TaxID=158019 RepID=A0A812CYR6_ACAPH|nr:unnamed protein product [Sepia pharaonis]
MGIIPENDTGQDNHPRRDIIMSLQQMLQESNSYVRGFKYALENNTTSDFIIVIDADKQPQREHERRYNAPASNEVSVIVSGDQHNRLDIVIESRGSGLRRISETHRSNDALQYPHLFPYRGYGAFYAYLLNQTKLRCELFLHIHLRDALRNDADPCNIANMCILPATFTGSPRYMHARTQDAMTYVRKYGRTDLFLTFTCNPKWQEGSVRRQIQDFLAGRVISRTEGPWHIFSFPIHERFPAIVQIAVHLENDELRYFSEDTTMDVAARTKDTTLTAFFKLYRQDEFATTLL